MQLCATTDSSIRLFTVDGGQLLDNSPAVDLEAKITCTTWSTDGRRLWVGCRHGEVLQYAVKQEGLKKLASPVVAEKRARITAVAANHDHLLLASDSSLTLHALKDATSPVVLDGHTPGLTVTHIDLAIEGIAISAAGTQVIIHDLTDATSCSIQGKPRAPITSLQCSPFSARLVVITLAKPHPATLIYDAAVPTAPVFAPELPTKDSSVVASLFSPINKSLLVFVNEVGEVGLADCERAKVVSRFHLQVPPQSTVKSASFGSDGKTVAFCLSNSQVIIQDMRDLSQLSEPMNVSVSNGAFLQGCQFRPSRSSPRASSKKSYGKSMKTSTSHQSVATASSGGHTYSSSSGLGHARVRTVSTSGSNTSLPKSSSTEATSCHESDRASPSPCPSPSLEEKSDTAPSRSQAVQRSPSKPRLDRRAPEQILHTTPTGTPYTLAMSHDLPASRAEFARSIQREARISTLRDNDVPNSSSNQSHQSRRSVTSQRRGVSSNGDWSHLNNATTPTSDDAMTPRPLTKRTPSLDLNGSTTVPSGEIQAIVDAAVKAAVSQVEQKMSQGLHELRMEILRQGFSQRQEMEALFQRYLPI